MKKYILISPYSKILRAGTYNAKNYPWWPVVIANLKNEYEVIQVGIKEEPPLVEDFRPNLKLKEVAKLIEDCFVWISVDNFFPHLAHLVGKPGIVVWGVSDPNIFGYKENKNLLKSKKYLRENQFFIWDGVKHDSNVFVTPEVIIKAVKDFAY
jgi:ADP-heptose:LPS heptosyltransferase